MLPQFQFTRVSPHFSLKSTPLGLAPTEAAIGWLRVPRSQPIVIPSGQARRKSHLRGGECGSCSIVIPSGQARRKSHLHEK